MTNCTGATIGGSFNSLTNIGLGCTNNVVLQNSKGISFRSASFGQGIAPGAPSPNILADATSTWEQFGIAGHGFPLYSQYLGTNLVYSVGTDGSVTAYSFTGLLLGSITLQTNLDANGWAITNAGSLIVGPYAATAYSNTLFGTTLITNLTADLANSTNYGGNAGSATYVTTATLTNSVYATNVTVRANYRLGTYSGVVVDATEQYQVFTTNADFSVSGFSGLVSGAQHVVSVTVSNSAATARIWTGPPTSFYYGTASTNALSIPAGKEAIISYWIRSNVRTNICNVVQQ
jgi:hypothetical protein